MKRKLKNKAKEGHLRNLVNLPIITREFSGPVYSSITNRLELALDDFVLPPYVVLQLADLGRHYYPLINQTQLRY